VGGVQPEQPVGVGEGGIEANARLTQVQQEYEAKGGAE
jgi:hypothetical protein